MFLQLCAVAVLLGNVQAFSDRNADDYLYKVLNNRFRDEAYYSRLDPYNLDDIEVPLSSSGVQVGKAVLSKGQLTRLMKVKRLGCSVPFYQSANITFTCFLGFENLQVSYSINVSLPNAKFTFKGEADVQGTNVTIQITSNKKVDVPNLNLLFINRIGTAKVTAFINVGDIGTLAGIAIDEALEKKTLETLHEVINGRFKNAVAYSIYRTPLGL